MKFLYKGIIFLFGGSAHKITIGHKFSFKMVTCWLVFVGSRKFL